MKTKFKVFFRRVSSKGQDLEMQISADAPYREQYLPNEIVEIEEFAVSANKLNLADRPKMLKLISMITSNQVDTIYVFDRSRLFRDYYEGSYFIDLCRKSNVKIFYTSDGHQQATDSPLIEGVLNIVSDIEGKNIARRTEEARRRYPSKKFGYIKIKESKQYKQDPTKSLVVKELIEDFLKVSSLNELDTFFTNYKKKLNTTRVTITKILIDPFYAGYDLSTNKNKLNHVEPYLSLSQFEELQAKSNLLESYEENISQLEKQNFFHPVCGLCGKPMIFRVNFMEQDALYSCSRGHFKNAISIKDLFDTIQRLFNLLIKQLDKDQLVNECRNYFKSIKKFLNSKLEELEVNKDRIIDEILLKDLEDISRWRENSRYKEFVTLENELKVANLNVINTEEQLLKNQTIVSILEDYLLNMNTTSFAFLYSMLSEKLTITQNEIDLDVKYFKYLNDIQETYVYENGEVL